MRPWDSPLSPIGPCSNSLKLYSQSRKLSRFIIIIFYIEILVVCIYIPCPVFLFVSIFSDQILSLKTCDCVLGSHTKQIFLFYCFTLPLFPSFDHKERDNFFYLNINFAMYSFDYW